MATSFLGVKLWTSSPKKQADRASANGAAPDPRGTKRKAKADPYEAIDDAGDDEDDDEDDDDDDDDVIPARKTPVSQRTTRSRLSSTTPGSSTRPRLSLAGRRPRHQPSLNLQQGDASDVAAASRANAGVRPRSARAKAPDTTRIPLDPPVPEAPMGGLELLGGNTADASATEAPKPQPEIVHQPPPPNKRRGKEKQIDSMAAQQAQDKEAATATITTTTTTAEAPPPPAAAVKPVEEAEAEEDTREEHEIARLLKHRMTNDREGVVELLVQWVGESEQNATWEAEEEIQQGADDVLYEYWKAQGGRVNALFHKPKNSPPEVYHVFKILRHEKKNRGGFQFEVQWIGHAATPGETSVEAEPKLKSIAPELLHEYWESVGGRASYLAPRGRAKKMRTE
ncbi:hypothetical protein F5X97DRAFT_7945 [Nemania serpens]|nr:hypothetical protein F5X97DRAFT_7945 [Nemania serpens]